MGTRCTIYLSDSLNHKIIEYMKAKGISMKSTAIKKCLEQVLYDDERRKNIFEINEKLNRILYRQNLNKKLLEQLFVNFGFPENYIVDKDDVLKEFYKNQNKYMGRFD